MTTSPSGVETGAVVLWASIGKKPRWVAGGRVEIRKCPECGETREFRECIVKRSVSIYSVIKLWEGGEYRAWACIGCGSCMDFDDTLEPELSARAERKLERQKQRELAEARAEAEREAARREQQRESRRREQQREAAAKQQQVEDELAAIKRRLGKESRG